VVVAAIAQHSLHVEHLFLPSSPNTGGGPMVRQMTMVIPTSIKSGSRATTQLGEVAKRFTPAAMAVAERLVVACMEAPL
jgi:hypothetical protein